MIGDALKLAFVVMLLVLLYANEALRDQVSQCHEVAVDCRATLADCINANSELTAPMPEPQSFEVPHGA